MKKVLIFILCLILSIQSFGQVVYNGISYLDRFNDAIKVESVKTIIEKTDSTFVIETKGKAPVTYYILNVLDAGCDGDKDNIVNLVGDVYGYQTCWCIVRKDMINDYIKDYNEVYKNTLTIKIVTTLTDEEKDRQINNELSKLNKYYLFAIHRVITTQYSHTYKTEYFWIEDELNTKLGNDINRIVYSK